MSSVCRMVTLVGLLSLPTWVSGQEPQPTQPESAPAPKPVNKEPYVPANTIAPPGVLGQNGPVTMRLDPCTNFPPSGPPVSLFSPFEFYMRTGAAINTGRGSFSEVLRTGVGVDAGVRSFLFNETQTAAWYGDLGIGYLYNDSSDSSVGFPRTEDILVTRQGQTLALPGVTTLGLRQLHRTNARLALGREYYFAPTWWEGMRYSLGGDLGGVWGQATVKTIVLDRDIPDLQQGDTVLGNRGDAHSSDVSKGFFFGCSFDTIFPCCYYDFVVGTRVEWQRDYFKIVDNGVGSSQLKLFLEVGWRF